MMERGWRVLAGLLLVAGVSAGGASVGAAQDTGASSKKAKAPKTAKAPKVADSAKVDGPPKPKKMPAPPLFASETPLAVTLTTNIKQIKKDKTADAPWRAATLSYAGTDGKTVTLPVRIKTRGVWRLKHCDYPPIRIKVGDKAGKGTVFEDIDEPKLVTYCRNQDDYEQYVLQEAQIYRMNRVLTDVSHKVRIVQVSYADSATGKVEVTRYSFIVEDPAQVARRRRRRDPRAERRGPGRPRSGCVRDRLRVPVLHRQHRLLVRGVAQRRSRCPAGRPQSAGVV